MATISPSFSDLVYYTDKYRNRRNQSDLLGGIIARNMISNIGDIDQIMIEHVVLFKWNEDATSEQISKAEEALKELSQKINGIIQLTIGSNFSSRSQGYETALVVRFKDRASLESYVPHPEHQAVVQNIINPIRTDTIVVDFEIE